MTILTVASGLSQILAPAVAGVLITALGGYRALFCFSAASALLGGCLAMRIRVVR